MDSPHTPPLQDKSLWMAILVPVLVMVSKLLGLDLSPEMLASIVGPALTFIMASKGKQAVIMAAQAKAEAVAKAKVVDLGSATEILAGAAK